MKDLKEKILYEVEELKLEAGEILDDWNQVWTDDFLSPHDFTPEFDLGGEEDNDMFNRIIGKILQCYIILKWI